MNQSKRARRWTCRAVLGALWACSSSQGSGVDGGAGAAADVGVIVGADAGEDVVEMVDSAADAATCVSADPCNVATPKAGGACVFTPTNEGKPCGTATGTCAAPLCVSGVCQPSTAPCAPETPCTTSHCNLAGECVTKPRPSGTTCAYELCAPGICDSNGGCVVTKKPDGAACGAHECVTWSYCVDGECKFGDKIPGACTGTTLCTSNVCCVPSNLWCFQPEWGTCQPKLHDNGCQGDSVCSHSQCDFDGLNQPYCRSWNDHGTPCDDGNPCTWNDHCQGATGCVSLDPKTCDDGNQCTTDVCDPATGGCSHAPVSGGYCNDINHVCLSGQCVPK